MGSTASDPGRADRWRGVAPDLWVLLLTVVLLGPALAPGFVLVYDMVWVPDLALGRDALGVGSALPRAVPSDAVVAVLDELLPGSLLQKVVLAGSLVGAGTGISRLAGDALPARLVTATAYLWNPFVVERLAMGHWPVLVGYAVLPWVVLAVRSWLRLGHPPRRLWWLLPLGSLSASTGIVLGLVVVVLVAVLRVRRPAYAVGLVVVANAPWLVSGLLHVGSATSSARGAEQFVLHDEGSVPGPLAALTLGGIWNSEVVPEARGGALGWIALVVLLPLAAAGIGGLRRQLGARLASALGCCALVGWVAAAVSWVSPDLVGWGASAVPGGGLLRDSSRLLALVAPLLALLLGQGGARVLQALPRAARPGAAVAVVLLPVALLPGVAWGLGGRLAPVDYPDDLAAARSALHRAYDAGEVSGDLVLLPFSSYRQPAWNDGRKVLDPTGRYLGADFVAQDALSVDGVLVPGEDPRAAAVGRALAQPAGVARSRALREEGIGVVVEEGPLSAASAADGAVVHQGSDLLLTAIGPTSAPAVPTTWRTAMAVAWTAYVVPGLVAALLALVQATRRGRGRADADG